jgi:hypothetical protein
VPLYFRKGKQNTGLPEVSNKKDSVTAAGKKDSAVKHMR